MLCKQCISGYATLGVAAEKSSGELKSVYRELAKRWHPDSHERDAPMRVIANQRLSAINAAYTHLSSCRRNREDARISTQKSRGFNNVCSVWRAGDSENSWSSVYGVAQRPTCRDLNWCSKSAWRKYTRWELLARTSTAAKVLAGFAAVSFAFVLFCCICPDAVNDLFMWVISIEA